MTRSLQFSRRLGPLYFEGASHVGRLRGILLVDHSLVRCRLKLSSSLRNAQLRRNHSRGVLIRVKTRLKICSSSSLLNKLRRMMLQFGINAEVLLRVVDRECGCKAAVPGRLLRELTDTLLIVHKRR